MIDFLLALTDAPRPAVKDIEEIWKDKSLTCTREAPEAVSELTTMLAARLGEKGKAVGVTCTLPDNNNLGWFVARARLSEIDFFYEMFRSKKFQNALSSEENLIPPQIDREFKPKPRRFIAESGYSPSNGDAVKEDLYRFESKSCFTQIGMLASDIYYAGADTDAGPGTDIPLGRETMHRAVLAGDQMLSSGFGNGLCYSSQVAWAPWFAAIEWDRTYVFIDKATRSTSFLMMTASE